MPKKMELIEKKVRLEQTQSAQAFHAAGWKTNVSSFLQKMEVRVQLGKKWIKGVIGTVCQKMR